MTPAPRHSSHSPREQTFGAGPGALVARLLHGAWRDTRESSKFQVPGSKSKLETRNSKLETLSEAELTEITPILCRNGSGALAWYKIQNTPLANTAAGEQLHEVYRRFRLAALVHEREIAYVFSLLRAEGIEAVLVKGWAIARRYPHPALRPYGDIDLCVAPQQFAEAQRALRCLESLDGHFIDLHDGFSHIGMKARNARLTPAVAREAGESIKPGVERSETPGVSVHQIRARGMGDSGSGIANMDYPQLATARRQAAAAHFVGSVSYPSPPWGSAALHPRLYAATRFRGFGKLFAATESLSDDWDELYSRSTVVECGGEPVRILSDEDHLRILSLHLLRSGAWRPVWLCDIALLLEQVQSPTSKVQSPLGLDRPWTLDLGHWPGSHANWVSTTIALAHELLGAEIAEEVRSPKSKVQSPLPRWLVPAVLKQWGRERTGGRRQEAVGRELRVQSGTSRNDRRPPTADRSRSSSVVRRPSSVPLFDFGHWTSLYARWNNPIRATAAVGGEFNNWPRLPYRAAESFMRLREGLRSLTSGAGQVSDLPARLDESLRVSDPLLRS